MSRSQTEQIVERFYSKVAQLVVNSRVHPALQTSIASRPWFLLANPESPEVHSRVQQLLADNRNPRVMYIDVLLNLSDVAASLRSNDAALFLTSSTTSEKLQLDSSFLNKKQMILLERWQLTFDQPINNHITYNALYSTCTIFFRALYTFLRTLPAIRLSQQLGRRGRGRMGNSLPLNQAAMKIEYNISTTRTLSSSVQQLDSSILGWPNDSTVQATFPGKVETPLGTFCLSVSYRTTCSFELTSLRDSPTLSDYVSVASPLSSGGDALGSYTFPDTSPRLTPATPPRPAPTRTNVWAEYPGIDSIPADPGSFPTDPFSLGVRPERSNSSSIPVPNSPPNTHAATPPRPVPARPSAWAAGYTPSGSTPPGCSPSSLPGRVHSGTALLLQNQWKTVGSNTDPALLEFMEMMKDTPRSAVATPAPASLSMTSEKSVDFRSLHSEIQSLQLQLSKSTTTEAEQVAREPSMDGGVLMQPRQSTLIETIPVETMPVETMPVKTIPGETMPAVEEKDEVLQSTASSDRPVMASPVPSADAPLFMPNFQSRPILPTDSEVSSLFSITSLDQVDVDNSQDDPSLLFNPL